VCSYSIFFSFFPAAALLDEDLDRSKTAIFQERAHHIRRQIKPRVPGAPPIATESAAESVLVRREADAIWLPFVT
jgi:hypothetical protein